MLGSVMSQNDVDYYRGRATEERERALVTDRRDVAAIHLELARLYDALVDVPAIRPTRRAAGPMSLTA